MCIQGRVLHGRVLHALLGANIQTTSFVSHIETEALTVGCGIVPLTRIKAVDRVVQFLERKEKKSQYRPIEMMLF